MKNAPVDRYVSFMGLDCDTNADQMMERLMAHLQKSDSRWVSYFSRKLEEKARMGHDNLNFIGCQLNTLAAFFEEEGDEEARALLAHLEDNCC